MSETAVVEVETHEQTQPSARWMQGLCGCSNAADLHRSSKSCELRCRGLHRYYGGAK